jgi:iron complex outermembrane receptor protein
MNKLTITIAVMLSLPAAVNAEEEIIDNDETNSVITETAEILPAIVVEGSSLRPGELGVAPGSSGLKDAASLLKLVPGANVNRNGPLTGIAQYRGMSGNRINISLDGGNMKEVGPNSMDPPLSHIPAAMTESLQVYRGIAPVSSGIDTIGGAMKLESKKGSFADGEGLETDGVISSGYSSVDDGYYGAGFTSIANKNHKAYFGFSKEEGENYKFSADDDLKVSPTSYDREVLRAGYGYRREDHEFGFNYTENNQRNTGTPALPMDIIYVRGGLYNANYDWDLGDGYKVKSKFFYQNMRHEMDNHTLRQSPLIRVNPMMTIRPALQNNTKVQGGGLDLEFAQPLFDGELTIGANGDQSNHNALITGVLNVNMMGVERTVSARIDNFNNVERDRYSGFAEWKGDFTEDLSAEFGVRYTYTQSDAGEVRTTRMMLPNGANERALAAQFNRSNRDKGFHEVDLVSILRHEVSSDFNIELGFARKNRAPSYQELYLWSPSEATGGLADGRNYIGNLDLEPETAYQAELGIEVNIDDFYIAPRFFYHYVDDYIQGTPATGAGTGTLQFNNIDAHLMGVDIESTYRVTEHWRVDAGLNYVYGERVDDVKDNLYRLAPLNGRAQLVFEHSGWMAAVEGVFVVRQSDVSEFNNELETPGYALLNLRSEYEAVEGMVIGAGVENVTDKTYFDHLGGLYRLAGDSNIQQGTRIPGQGRNFYATLTYNW